MSECVASESIPSLPLAAAAAAAATGAPKREKKAVRKKCKRPRNAFIDDMAVDEDENESGERTTTMMTIV